MYHIIYNPQSKGSKSQAVFRAAMAQLKVRQPAYILHKTEYPGHAEDITRDLTREPLPCTILIIGGDGTLNDVLNGICHPEYVTLGLIPSGSGNDFARAVGISKNPQKAIALILNSMPKNIHYGIMQTDRKTRRFLISCGAGFDSEVCRETHSSGLKKLLSKISLENLAYSLVAMKSMLLRSVFSARLVTDTGSAHSYDNITFVTAFNAAYEGGGFRFCPPANPRHPKLHTLCIHDVPLYQLPPLFPLARAGKHLAFTSKVALLATYHTKMTFSKPVCIHTDGEIIGYASSLSVQASKDTIRIFLPTT